MVSNTLPTNNASEESTGTYKKRFFTNKKKENKENGDEKLENKEEVKVEEVEEKLVLGEKLGDNKEKVVEKLIEKIEKVEKIEPSQSRENIKVEVDKENAGKSEEKKGKKGAVGFAETWGDVRRNMANKSKIR